MSSLRTCTATSAACTGAITTAAVWKLTKIGNQVTLTLPDVVGTATAEPFFAFGTTIPAKYRPAANMGSAVGQLTDNGVVVPAAGLLLVSTGGSIQVYRSSNGTTNFTASASAGLSLAISMSWTI